MEQLRAAAARFFLRHDPDPESQMKQAELLRLAERVHQDDELAHENLARINAVAAFVGIQDMDWWRDQHPATEEDHER